MKIASIIIFVCLIVIAAVTARLAQTGIALRPAGVIKPTLTGPDHSLIAKSIGLRLYPEFHSHQHVVWIATSEIQEQREDILNKTLAQLSAERATFDTEVLRVSAIDELAKRLKDFKMKETVNLDASNEIEKKFWWVLEDNSENVLEQLKAILSRESHIVIFQDIFRRADPVPATCEEEKQLTRDCMKYVSVRAVQKKFRSSEPYFFMQRYRDNEFYLFVESQTK